MPRIERGVGYSESPYGTCEQQNLGSEQQVAKPVLALRTIFAAWNSLKNLKKEERQRRAQDAGSTEAGRDITTLRCKSQRAWISWQRRRLRAIGMHCDVPDGRYMLPLLFSRVMIDQVSEKGAIASVLHFQRSRNVDLASLRIINFYHCGNGVSVK